MSIFVWIKNKLEQLINCCYSSIIVEVNTTPAAEEKKEHMMVSNENNLKAQFRDVITLWSTIEGFVSWRFSTGSTFIQSLCRQLQDFGGDDFRDLYEAHLDVTQEVTDKLHPEVIKSFLSGLMAAALILASSDAMTQMTVTSSII